MIQLSFENKTMTIYSDESIVETEINSYTHRYFNGFCITEDDKELVNFKIISGGCQTINDLLANAVCLITLGMRNDYLFKLRDCGYTDREIGSLICEFHHLITNTTDYDFKHNFDIGSATTGYLNYSKVLLGDLIVSRLKVTKEGLDTLGIASNLWDVDVQSTTTHSVSDTRNIYDNHSISISMMYDLFKRLYPDFIDYTQLDKVFEVKRREFDEVTFND